MQEQAVREVLHTVAANADVPERFLHPSQVAHSRRPNSRWRRPLLTAAAALLVTALFVATVPGVRVLAEELANGLQTIWSGKVGGAPAVVFWADPSHNVSHPLPEETVRTFAEAAKAVGFRPAETHTDEARLSNIIVQKGEPSGQERYATVSAIYRVGAAYVTLLTEGTLIEKDGAWQLKPYERLMAGDGQARPMVNVRTVKLGSTEAVAFDEEMVQGKVTVISWLQDGLLVHVIGADPALVERVAAGAVR